jgi:hypothetical protein
LIIPHVTRRRAQLVEIPGGGSMEEMAETSPLNGGREDA